MTMLPYTHNSKQKSTNVFKSFLRNSSGSLSPIFGLAAIPFMFVAGAAVDFSRITREQVAFYGAVDGAALAIAADDRSALEMLPEGQREARRAELEIYAQKYLQKNYKDVSGGNAVVDVDLSITGSAVKLDATIDFPMTIMALAGIDNTTLKASSTIKKAMKPIELVMVMDTTGSMKNDMTGLKTAANNLLSKLYADPVGSKNMESEFIRTALVPFSAAVRLDTSAYDYSASWIDTTGTNPLSKIHFTDPTWNNYMAWGKLKRTSSAFQTWNGCVESRKFGVNAENYITEDIAPNAADIHSKFPAYFNPDSPSWYTGSNANNYKTSPTGSTLTGQWPNSYIGAYANYVTTSANAATLAPSGSAKTGYDDSTIGNNNVGFDARWKNPAKYDGKNIGSETLTLSGDGVTWSANAGPWVNCTASKVVPMTYKRANIEAGIASMKAYGGTNIAEGLAWGMRALSPTEPLTKVEAGPSIAASTIAPYNGPRWQKILVLMTDGENDPYARSGGTPVQYTDTGTSYNSFGYSNVPTALGLNRYNSTNFNNADDQLNTYTTTMCNKLKANGVTIYTIGFRVDSTLMKSCATSLAHYKYATSVTDLTAYFDHIGQDVLNKMIYVSK